MSLVLLGVAIFDFLLEKFEDYLHHNKGRFHRRLLHKVPYLVEIVTAQSLGEDLYAVRARSVGRG